MGLSANSYQLFKTLGDSIENKQNPMHSEMQRLLSKFSLQCIIIYDPEKDPLFAKTLEHDFRFFDRLTMDRMLFMTLLKQSVSSERESYYDFFRQESWFGKNAAVRVNDISLATQLLCNKLNIEYEYAPYILFTSSFTNNWFYYTSLTFHDVEQVMRLLTTVANNTSANSEPRLLGEIVGKLAPELSNRTIFKRSYQTIAQVLSSFLQPINQINTEGFRRSYLNESKDRGEMLIHQSNQFWRRNNKQVELERIEASLINFSGIDTLVYDTKPPFEVSHNRQKRISSPEKGKTILAKFLGYLEGDLKDFDKNSIDEDTNTYTHKRSEIKKERKVKTQSHSSLNYIQEEYLEQESKNFIKIARHLEATPELWRAADDFSFYTVNLAKAFEKELNFSIVQLIRSIENIEMPDYFARLKPDNDPHEYLPDNIGLSTPRPVALNNGNGIQWRAPGIGESFLVWKSLSQKNMSGLIDYFPDMREILNASWHEIHRVRNLTAHMGQVTRKDCDKMIDAVNKLNSAGVLSEMFSLKWKLKGNKYSQNSLQDDPELF